MAQDLAREFLDVTTAEFRSYKRAAEKAIAQLPDDALARRIDEGSNSVAVLMRHVGGNLRSRFTDFLTTDGEKPDRHRDREFEDGSPSREALLADWERGWSCLLDTLAALSPDDLSRQVVIRDEPLGVVKALQRSLAHVALHVGQIVFLAKHLAGGDWTTLSIPRGESEAFNEKMRGKRRPG